MNRQRSAPRKGKVILPNDTAHDAQLSYRALGLLAAMLARPAEASFDMREFALHDERRPGREGRGALLTAARELRDRGYVWTFQVKRGGRRGVVTETVVSAEPITEDEARERLAGRSRSKEQESKNSTPVYRTPVHSTPLPTEGHPPTSLRSVEGKRSIAHDDCPHRCGPDGWIQTDENTVRPCPEHRARRTS